MLQTIRKVWKTIFLPFALLIKVAYLLGNMSRNLMCNMTTIGHKKYITCKFLLNETLAILSTKTKFKLSNGNLYVSHYIMLYI